MTDKEKIREEVKRKLDVMQYQVHRKDAYKELKSILDYIDSLQEEPVSEGLDLVAMQKMEECPFREVGCTMYKDKILECNGACSWVVDYHKLKELKAQKRE